MGVKHRVYGYLLIEGMYVGSIFDEVLREFRFDFMLQKLFI